MHRTRWLLAMAVGLATAAFFSLRPSLMAGELTGKKDDPPPVTPASLDARMKWEVERGFSGVVLFAKEGRVEFHKAYGLANRDKNLPMRLDTVFAIGSTPIDFTKAGILLLAERGKLSLKDLVSKHLAGVPEDKKAMTIEHLMTGRSGLQDFHDVPGDRDPDHGWIDRNEAVRRILGQKLLFAPGKGRKHSHSAWGLLAAILELTSGQSYQDFTREHLFKPAGMKDTGFFGEKCAEERLAVGYGPRKDGSVNAPPFWGKTSWLVMGSGGQVSTAEDMWRWTRAVKGGKLLSKESMKLYSGPGEGILAGGDMYGFEILYAGNARSFVVILTNAGSPKRMRAWNRLGEDLARLVIERKPGKFSLGVQLDVDDGKVKIAEVMPGGAADRGGLRAGDVLLEAAGKPLGDEPAAALSKLLQSGEAIEFLVERAGKRLKVTVKPAAR